MGSIPAILDILVKTIRSFPKKKPIKKFPQKIVFKSFKKQFLKFNVKNKKNQYWLKKNKWKYFFSDSNHWFALKKKIKSNVFLFNKQKNLTAFFYFEKNFLNIFRHTGQIATRFCNIFSKIQILRNPHGSHFSARVWGAQTLFYFIADVRKNLILFLHFYHFFNQNSFLFNWDKIENFKSIRFNNLAQTLLKNEFARSVENCFLISASPLSPINSNLANLAKTSNFYNKRKEQRFFLNFKLIKLFYKKNKYGFFWLASVERFSHNCAKVTLQALNLNKFFLLNRKVSNKFSQKFIFRQSRSLFINENAAFFQEAFGTKTFLTPKSRYSNNTHSPFILTKGKSLYTYFYTYRYRAQKKILTSNKNRSVDRRVFALTASQNKHPLSIFQKTIDSLKNFNFFFTKEAFRISNLEFFFSNELMIYNFKFLLTERAVSNLPRSITTAASFINFYLNNFFFYSKTTKNFTFTNLFANSESFSFVFKKFLIKTFSTNKFSVEESPLHYDAICRFLEFCSGKRIYAVFNPFMTNMLDFEEKTRCLIWSQKIKSFRKVLGPRLFLNESLQIIYFCLKNKDVYVLASWMLQMFYKISFWKYKLFFRYLQYVLRYFFWSIFESLRITGLKFQMKGKISVAGNARTRTVLTKIGTAGHSSFKNRILYDLKLIRTFTGVIGFKTWIFF